MFRKLGFTWFGVSTGDQVPCRGCRVVELIQNKLCGRFALHREVSNSERRPPFRGPANGNWCKFAGALASWGRKRKVLHDTATQRCPNAVRRRWAISPEGSGAVPGVVLWPFEFTLKFWRVGS